MPRFMSKSDVVDMLVTYFPSHLRSRAQAKMLDSWMNGTQYDFSEDLEVDSRGYGRPFSPREHVTNDEHENLRALSPNSFAGLIVSSVSQLAHLEGIDKPGTTGTLPVYDTFRRNRWLSKQSSIHRAALGHSTSYGIVLPGKDALTDTPMARMSGRSAIQMSGFYDSDDDEWATLAIEAEKRTEPIPGGLGFQDAGWTVKVYDDYVIHRLISKGDGLTVDDWTYIDFIEHGMPVPPVARCVNRLDLDGRARGVIEPVLPILRRLDQDTFDRLINQRFGAWQVRYIAGMAKPEKKSDQEQHAMQLRVTDLLVSSNKDTKFGTLPGGSIEPQIAATDHDLRLLSAIAQVPPHHLLGLSSNLQAEALAAAAEGLQRQGYEFRVNAGEFHEQMARLCAMAEGDFVTAAAWDLRVRWKDTESTSMSQAADALGKLAAQLGVPIEMLWERIPGWTDDDVQRAKELVENGSIEQILQELVGNTNQDQNPDQQQAQDQGATGGNAQ